MLDKKTAFKTDGDFILDGGDGTEVSREIGLSWFDVEIKKCVNELLLDLYDNLKPDAFKKTKEIIDKHFKVLDGCE